MSNGEQGMLNVEVMVRAFFIRHLPGLQCQQAFTGVTGTVFGVAW
jgi:hypothetical protein